MLGAGWEGGEVTLQIEGCKGSEMQNACDQTHPWSAPRDGCWSISAQVRVRFRVAVQCTLLRAGSCRALGWSREDRELGALRRGWAALAAGDSSNATATFIVCSLAK